jgi:hypothetical protein
VEVEAIDPKEAMELAVHTPEALTVIRTISWTLLGEKLTGGIDALLESMSTSRFVLQPPENSKFETTSKYLYFHRECSYRRYRRDNQTDKHHNYWEFLDKQNGINSSNSLAPCN